MQENAIEQILALFQSLLHFNCSYTYMCGLPCGVDTIDCKNEIMKKNLQKCIFPEIQKFRVVLKSSQLFHGL